MRHYVLELCDEQRTIDQIISAVHERYADEALSRECIAELVIGILSSLTQ